MDPERIGCSASNVEIKGDKMREKAENRNGGETGATTYH